jgi:2'-5' RNA ligase
MKNGTAAPEDLAHGAVGPDDLAHGVVGAEDLRVRVFFALVPDLATRALLAGAALPFCNLGRAVALCNYHMTLAFIGAVPASQLPLLCAIGGAQRWGRFALRFDAYEHWPKPEVLVAAARTVPEALQHFWRQLHEDLAVHRLALAPKRLRPHVTLVRRISQDLKLPVMPSFDWPVREFSLMRSETSGGESAYTVIDTWPLLDTRESG